MTTEPTAYQGNYVRITSPMSLVECLEEGKIKPEKIEKVTAIREAIVRIWEGAREGKKMDLAVCVQCWKIHWGHHPIKGCETRHLKAIDGLLVDSDDEPILDKAKEHIPQCNPEVPLWPLQYDVGVVIPREES